MAVIEMKPIVANILKNIDGLKDFSTNYPSTWNTFPLAIYRTAQRPHFIDYQGKELQTHWEITVEIYSDTGSLTPIMNAAVSAFSEIGFKGDGSDANTANLKRVVCKFQAIVDNATRIVYQK